MPVGRGGTTGSTRPPTGRGRGERGAAGRGGGGGRGARGGRTIVGGVELPVRTGPWRERHDRPELETAPANEEAADSDNSGNDPGFMGGEEEESEDVSLEDEEGEGAPATEATDVPSPADLADVEAIWQTAGDWDVTQMQRGDQPFLVRRVPPQILDSYCLCLLATLLRLKKFPDCAGAWKAQGAGTASSTLPEQRPPSPPPARTRSAAGSARQGSAAQSRGSAAPTPSPRSTNNALHRASAAPTGKGRSSSAPLPTAGPTRPGPAARPKGGEAPSEGRDQERLVDAQANPIHAGKGDGEGGTGRRSAGRLARGDADAEVAATGVAPAEQGLQQAPEEERREAQQVHEAPSGAARTRSAAAPAALGFPPRPALTAAAARAQAQRQLTAPTAEGPSPTLTKSAAATSQAGTLGAGAAVAGTAQPGWEGTDPVVGPLAAHTGAGDEEGGGGGRIAREAVVGEVPVPEKTGTSAGEEPVREEEAGRQRRQPRPQLHPRRLGEGLGLAHPGPLAGWERQEDLPDGPAEEEVAACLSSGRPVNAAEETRKEDADLAEGADQEEEVLRRAEAERRRRTGTSRQRTLQDQADDRAAGLQPSNAAPRAAGRGRGRGQTRGRGSRDLAGAVAREKARSGFWRERHGRPEEQGEEPMNEEEREEGSDYMASQEAESEDTPLEAERGVPIPATERGQGSGQGRREEGADVGESAPQQPIAGANVAASKERSPSAIVDDEGTWRILQFLPRLTLRANLEKTPGNRWAGVEKRLAAARSRHTGPPSPTSGGAAVATRGGRGEWGEDDLARSAKQAPRTSA
ncbi:unnamed protein product [Closterium sp. Naga37s-1]|nr:unnamed protein product [Closterium sp. Naga37s-1]